MRRGVHASTEPSATGIGSTGARGTLSPSRSESSQFLGGSSIDVLKGQSYVVVQEVGRREFLFDLANLGFEVLDRQLLLFVDRRKLFPHDDEVRCNLVQLRKKIACQRKVRLIERGSDE